MNGKTYLISDPKEKYSIVFESSEQTGSLAGKYNQKQYKITHILHLAQGAEGSKYKMVYTVYADTDELARTAMAAYSKRLVEQMSVGEFEAAYVKRSLPFNAVQLNRTFSSQGEEIWTFHDQDKSHTVTLDSAFMRRLNIVLAKRNLASRDPLEYYRTSAVDLRERLGKLIERKRALHDRYLQVEVEKEDLTKSADERKQLAEEWKIMNDKRRSKELGAHSKKIDLEGRKFKMPWSEPRIDRETIEKNWDGRIQLVQEVLAKFEAVRTDLDRKTETIDAEIALRRGEIADLKGQKAVLPPDQQEPIDKEIADKEAQIDRFNHEAMQQSRQAFNPLKEMIDEVAGDLHYLEAALNLFDPAENL